jgi:tripartite-type tricarboxylate transporter receptor subunit TctC
MRVSCICTGMLAYALAAANLASAEDKWPSRPVRMIVPFPAGAASDVTGRIIGQRLTELYGQQIVADNRPGAGGLIGSQLIRDAAPDGYTIAMIGQPHLSNVLLRADKPYDPLKDFVAIGLTSLTPNIIVLGKGIDVKTIPELITLAKQKPGTLNFGSGGVGSSSHLAGALFQSKAKIDVVHVPFRQGGESRTALINGAIQYYIYPLPAIVTLIKAGTLKALAVTSTKRASALPELPTSAEAGFAEYVSVSWFGLIGPRGMPKRIVDKLNADVLRVLDEPVIRQKFEQQGAEPGFGSPEQFAKMQRDEYKELGALIKEIGMKAQ